MIALAIFLVFCITVLAILMPWRGADWFWSKVFGIFGK